MQKLTAPDWSTSAVALYANVTRVAFCRDSRPVIVFDNEPSREYGWESWYRRLTGIIPLLVLFGRSGKKPAVAIGVPSLSAMPTDKGGNPILRKSYSDPT